MKLADFNTAKALQELGYDGYYNYIYAKNTESSLRYIGFEEVFEISEYTGPPAPRLDDVAYWIRDRHKISIEVIWSPCTGFWKAYAGDMKLKAEDFGYKPYELTETMDINYEDALELAIRQAIEIIKQRQQ